MKEKEDKHPSFHKSTSTVEPKVEMLSSTSLTLKKLLEEKEKKESAAESSKVRCKICFKEVAPQRRCGGHGAGAGSSSGGGGGSSASDEKASQNAGLSLSKPDEIDDTTKAWLGEFCSIEDNEELDFDVQSEESFDSEVIAELINKGLLEVNNDRESMSLTINLRCHPNELSKKQRDELKKYMGAVLKELNEFKKEHHISDECVKIMRDEAGNMLSLRITLPTPDLYDAFIQRLANNLSPEPNPELQAKNESQMIQHAAPTPFSTEPNPSASTKEQHERDKAFVSKKVDDEEQENFNPSPFSTKMKPW